MRILLATVVAPNGEESNVLDFLPTPNPRAFCDCQWAAVGSPRGLMSSCKPIRGLLSRQSPRVRVPSSPSVYLALFHQFTGSRVSRTPHVIAGPGSRDLLLTRAIPRVVAA